MDVLLLRGVGIAPPPAPFEWGPHQSHPFVHSCVHPVIQQLILTEQAHGPAPGWAPATLAHPLMASASPGGGGPGGCFCPGWPRGSRARGSAGKAGGVGCEGRAWFGRLGGGGGPGTCPSLGLAAGPSQPLRPSRPPTPSPS